MKRMSIVALVHATHRRCVVGNVYATTASITLTVKQAQFGKVPPVGSGITNRTSPISVAEPPRHPTWNSACCNHSQALVM